MKIKNISELKLGDWIITAKDLSKGHFQFGEITGLRIEEVWFMDLDKIVIKKQYSSELKKKAGAYFVLNKKELDKLLKLKVKLGVIEGLR